MREKIFIQNKYLNVSKLFFDKNQIISLKEEQKRSKHLGSKTVCHFLKKLNIELSYDPETIILGINLR